MAVTSSKIKEIVIGAIIGAVVYRLIDYVFKKFNT